MTDPIWAGLVQPGHGSRRITRAQSVTSIHDGRRATDAPTPRAGYARWSRCRDVDRARLDGRWSRRGLGRWGGLARHPGLGLRDRRGAHRGLHGRQLFEQIARDRRCERRREMEAVTRDNHPVEHGRTWIAWADDVRQIDDRGSARPCRRSLEHEVMSAEGVGARRRAGGDVVGMAGQACWDVEVRGWRVGDDGDPARDSGEKPREGETLSPRIAIGRDDGRQARCHGHQDQVRLQLL